MALGLENLVNTHPVSAAYPWKDIKDDTGANDGTPVDRVSHADYHQFFRKLLDLVGISPNATPDNATNGYQYIEALLLLSPYERAIGVIRSITPANFLTHAFNITGQYYTWNLATTAFITNLTSSFVSQVDIVTINGIKEGATQSFMFELLGGNFSIILNSTNTGGAKPIQKEGIAGADTAMTIVNGHLYNVIELDTYFLIY